MGNEPFIKLVDVSKIYTSKGTSSIGLQNVSAEFSLGEFVAITGESGSGKSTLLNVIACQDVYEEGELFINGEETSEVNISKLDSFRNNNISFIFQDYNIVESYSVLENVMLPLLARGIKKREAKKLALEVIEKVGLSSVKDSSSSKLSGGEKQRTVIARALMNNTPVLACDEPTGNLDSKTGAEIVALLKEVSKYRLVLFVTHDYASLKDSATRHIELKDGHIVLDERLKEFVPLEYVKPAETKTISTFSAVLIGLKNFIKTPKKSLLISAISLVSGLIICGAGITAVNIDDTYRGSFYTFYSDLNQNRLANRVTVRRKNIAAKSPDEILNTKYDYFLDKGSLTENITFKISFQKANGVYEANPNPVFLNILSSDDKLISGEKLKDDNEIAIYGHNIKEIGPSFFKDEIGKDIKISLYDNLGDEKQMEETVKLAGVYSSSHKLPTGFSVVGGRKFVERYLAKIKYEKLEAKYNLPFLENSVLNVDGKQILLDAHPIDYETKFDKIVLSSIYKGKPIEYSIMNTKIKLGEEDVIFRDDLKFGYYHTRNSFTKLAEKYDLNTTIILNNANDKTEVMKLFSNDDYIVLNNGEYFEDFQIGTFIATALLMLVIFLPIVIFSFYIAIYLETMIYKRNLKDYSIFKTCGFSANKVSLFPLFEQLLTITCSLLLFVILISIALNFSSILPNGYIAIFENPVFYYVTFIFGILYSIRFSMKLRKKIEITTVSKGLREDEML
ncbi:MAG: ATP-binding cassette domain-containing protein [Bacilli bacterium]